ncbi:MAG: polysaccharide deacetylase family protein [Candidatus Omnitrophica bacterium]|nr:polysaccharide deacetylase family protein [Candidatus Omnitrophota bacterium]
MAGKLLIGYDVECESAGVAENFLTCAGEIHKRLNAPATLFVVGKVLDKYPQAFRKAQQLGIFDFQQHTYSHVNLKPVKIEGELKKAAGKWRISRELKKANGALKRHLGLSAEGLTTPYTHHLGLSDRPDLLKILRKAGVRFVRSFGRDRNDQTNISLDLQPFWYDNQGFPEILEFPVQAWKGEYFKGYDDYLCANLDYIAEHDLVWSFLQHDSSHHMRGNEIKDPQLHTIERLIRYAKDKGIILELYKDYYRRLLNDLDPNETPKAG